MPKLPGLTELCCLLYSPIVGKKVFIKYFYAFEILSMFSKFFFKEFRIDENKTRLTGVLCGKNINKSFLENLKNLFY